MPAREPPFGPSTLEDGRGDEIADLKRRLREVEVVDLGGVKAARMTLQPGWRWSECIKPVAGTDSCQARHVGTVVAGRIHVKHDDGTEAEMGPGDAYVIEPGHDAWIVGNEPLVGFEFESTTASSYAKPS